MSTNPGARVSAQRQEFFKSSFSGGGDCVQVAFTPAGGIRLRDSKAADGPVLSFTATEWRAFLDGVYAGEFEPPQ